MYKITLLSLLSVATLYAEPSPVVQYLMKEHVTMFDWGILRTEIEMKESINSHPPDSQMGTLWRHYQIGADVSAGYNFNQNRIRIVAFIAPEQWVDRAGFTEELARDVCKKTIEKMRINQGINADGEPLAMLEQETSSLFHNFTHSGFTSQREPNNLAVKIDNMTLLQATVLYHEEKNLTCGAPLVHGPVSFKE